MLEPVGLFPFPAPRTTSSYREDPFPGEPVSHETACRVPHPFSRVGNAGQIASIGTSGVPDLQYLPVDRVDPFVADAVVMTGRSRAMASRILFLRPAPSEREHEQSGHRIDVGQMSPTVPVTMTPVPYRVL
jgi:hypothetical protein